MMWRSIVHVIVASVMYCERLVARDRIPEAKSVVVCDPRCGPSWTPGYCDPDCPHGPNLGARPRPW